MIRRLITTLCASILGATLVAGVAEACPDRQLEPRVGAITLDAGFLPDPYSRNVTAGGAFTLLFCGFNWQGYVYAAPDFDLYYDAASGVSLTFYVQSNIDTVLLINDPSGGWQFNDNGAGGLNPSITINRPQSGTYNVWIGTHSLGVGAAQLFITERCAIK